MLQTYTAAYKGGLSGPVIFPRSLSQAEEAAVQHDLCCSHESLK